MNIELMARYGRIVLWGRGSCWPYLMPHEVYAGILHLLDFSEYMAQERVLMQRPWTDVVHRLGGVAMLTAGVL